MNICADDYGIDLKVNTAIINLAQLKKISSVSVLIKKCSSADVAALKKLNGVRIGLHLDLFKENPFINYFKLILTPQNLHSEINEQIRLFKFKFGFFPHYIDGHMHCQLYPVIGKTLVNILSGLQLTPDFYVRSCNVPESLKAGFIANKLYLAMLTYFNKGFTQQLKQHNINTNGHLYGAFNNHLNIERTFESFRLNAKSGDVFFFHPSTDNIQPDQAPDTIARKHEYEYLAKI